MIITFKKSKYPEDAAHVVQSGTLYAKDHKSEYETSLDLFLMTMTYYSFSWKKRSMIERTELMR